MGDLPQKPTKGKRSPDTLEGVLARIQQSAAKANRDQRQNAEKERKRKRSLDLDKGRDKPRTPATPGLLPKPGRTRAGHLRMKAGLMWEAATNGRLQATATRWLDVFLYKYTPGQTCKEPAVRIGRDATIATASTERATRQLKRLGYLARFNGGWVCPPLEMKLAPGQRAWRKGQISFQHLDLNFDRHAGKDIRDSMIDWFETKT